MSEKILRPALLWILWHHQGGSSQLGQSIRLAIGMGQHEEMNEQQLATAKEFEARNSKPEPGQPAANMAQEINLNTIENLAMMMRRLIYFANKTEGDTSLKVVAGNASDLLGRYFLSGNILREQPAAGQSEPVAQGKCETTLTERFAYPDCKCSTYEGNLGPCKTWEPGGDPTRCVYCDHDAACHIALYTHPIPAAPAVPKGWKINVIDLAKDICTLEIISPNGAKVTIPSFEGMANYQPTKDMQIELATSPEQQGGAG